MEKAIPENIRVLNIEKRLVDVELSVAQIGEKIKSLDTSMLSDLRQKEEDLEDLVLVNNAGMMELKKMLESPAQTIAVPDELKSRVDQLSSEVEALKQVKPAEQTEDVRAYVDEKLAEIQNQIPEAPQLNVDDIKNELSIAKTRLTALEKSTTESKLSEPILNELQSIREDLLTAKSKVASTEKYTQDTRMDLEKMKPSVARLENVANFNPTIDQAEAKIEQMMGLISKVEETIAKMSVADFVSKGQLTDAVGKMNEKLSDMGRRLEGNRLFLIEMFKEDMNKALSRLDASTVYSNVNKMVESKLARFETALNERLKETVKSFDEVLKGPSIIDEQMIELVNRTLYLETRLSVLEKTIKDFEQSNMPIIIE